jgi:hypothetical protein
MKQADHKAPPRDRHTLSALLRSTQRLARDLAEHILRQQDAEYTEALGLQSFIASAYRDLIHCAEMINARAPVSRVPADVLELIFFSVPQGDQRPEFLLNPVPHTNEPFPLCISRVSRPWRHVAFYRPLLWTSVKISPVWNVSSVKTHLEASKSLPIELKIDAVSRYSAPCGVETATALSNIVSSAIPRCRSFSFVVTLNNLPLFQGLRDRIDILEAPILESLTLDIMDKPQNVEDIYLKTIPLLFKGGAPNLKDIRINTLALYLCLPPLSHVTTLHLKGTEHVELLLTRVKIFDVLSQCQVLQRLVIHHRILEDCDPAQTHTLPALRSLHMFGSINVADILSCISAPLLEDIFISHHKTEEWESDSSLVFRGSLRFPAVKTLAFRLDKIYLQDHDMSESLTRAFRCFPDIENLALGPSAQAKSHVIQTFIDTNEGKCWPNLRSLALRINDEASENALCDFVILRKAVNMPLYKISLDAASLLRMSRLVWLRTQLEVVECDMWRELLKGAMFADELDRYN